VEVCELAAAVSTILDLLDKPTISQILYLASTELRDVRLLPERLLSTHLHQLTFLFTPVDPWNPPSQQHHLKSLFPSANMRMLPIHVQHAFVLGNSREVAEVIWQEIKKVQQQRKHGKRQQLNQQQEEDEDEDEDDEDEQEVSKVMVKQQFVNHGENGILH